MTAALTFSDGAGIETLVRRFLSRSLPKEEWTHQAHLAVGLWHALAYPFAEALDRLRAGIRAHNEAVGLANDDEGGYHETLTVLFLHALKTYADLQGPGRDRLALFNALPHSRLRDKLLPLAFYSRARVMSVTARREWSEPDLQPLSGLPDLLRSPTSAHPFYLRLAGKPDAAAFLSLVIALAEFEKLPPPDADARERLIQDAFSLPPRFETWLAVADSSASPVGYAIFLETYSSFLARPTLYIEDIFVLPEHRGKGIGSALLRKSVDLAHRRGCGRIEWTVLDWNVGAQRVYEQRLGARRLQEWFLYRMTREDMERHMAKGG